MLIGIDDTTALRNCHPALYDLAGFLVELIQSISIKAVAMHTAISFLSML